MIENPGWRYTRRNRKCANDECPNSEDAGTFAVVETASLVVGNKRGMRFVMCVPCAEALYRELAR